MTIPSIKNKDQNESYPGAKESKMHMNIWSPWKYFEDLEALIYCLELPFMLFVLVKHGLKWMMILQFFW